MRGEKPMMAYIPTNDNTVFICAGSMRCFCENVKTKSYRIIVLVECAVFTSFCKNPNGAIATVFSFSWFPFARKGCGNGRSFFTGKTKPKTYQDELTVDSI